MLAAMGGTQVTSDSGYKGRSEGPDPLSGKQLSPESLPPPPRGGLSHATQGADVEKEKSEGQLAAPCQVDDARYHYEDTVAVQNPAAQIAERGQDGGRLGGDDMGSDGEVDDGVEIDGDEIGKIETDEGTGGLENSEEEGDAGQGKGPLHDGEPKADAFADDGQVEDDLDCPMCMDVFCEPVEAPCGHAFCQMCLVRAVALAPHQGCPICRVTLDGSPADLKICATLEKAAILRVGERVYQERRKTSGTGGLAETLLQAPVISRRRANEGSRLVVASKTSFLFYRPNEDFLSRLLLKGRKNFMVCTSAEPAVGEEVYIVEAENVNLVDGGGASEVSVRIMEKSKLVMVEKLERSNGLLMGVAHSFHAEMVIAKANEEDNRRKMSRDSFGEIPEGQQVAGASSNDGGADSERRYGEHGGGGRCRSRRRSGGEESGRCAGGTGSCNIL